MLRLLKNTLRRVLFLAGIDFTKNQQYDRQTLAIMKKVLKPNSNCIDIGCHKGEVMDEMIKHAPNGSHYGFEPIPEYYNFLLNKYHLNKNIKIFNTALSNSSGLSEFNWVKNAPAYSGLKERSYAIKNPQIKKIEVELTKLDDISNDFHNIAFIKIDVEGAEMKVLQGSINLIKKHNPIIVFEYGMGAADFYGITPEAVFSFFAELNYELNTLKGFINNAKGLAKNEFAEMYDKNTEYYFIAFPLK